MMLHTNRRALLGASAALALRPRSAWAKTDLAFWTFLPMQGTDPRSQALRDVVAGFNASQSEYQVNVQTIDFARIDNTVIQSTSAGRGPDILNVNTDLLQMHVAAHTIIPLDDYVAKLPQPEPSDFVMPLDALKIAGHQMAVPWEVRVWLLWYRQDLLQNSGLALPKTLDELGQEAGAISSQHVMGFAMAASSGQLALGVLETFTPLLWDAGGRLLEDNKAVFNSPAGIRVMTYIRDLITRYKAMNQNVVTMTVDDVLAAIKAGTAASTFQGSFRVSAARNSAATGDKLQTAPIPGWTADKPSPARLAAQTLAIGANSKNPEGAWAFIQYYLSPKSQLAFARAGVMPARKSVYDEPMFRDDATGREILRWSQYIGRYGRLELMPVDFPKFTQALAEAAQKVLIAGADPAAALDAAAQSYNAQHKG